MRRLSVLMSILGAALVLSSTGTTASADDRSVLVLDTSGYWRTFFVLKPPVVIDDDGHVAPLPHPSGDTPFPPASWTQPDFDDSGWVRQRGPSLPNHEVLWWGPSRQQTGGANLNSASPAVAMLAVRGKFIVDQPEKVRGLKISVTYRGGVIVRVNGTEIARKHLKPVAQNDTPERENAGPLAEKYPREAYLYADGNVLLTTYQGYGKAKQKAVMDRYLLRNRTITDVPVPTRLLRRGVNVLAIEVRRAPYDAILLEKFKGCNAEHRYVRSVWDTCAFVGCRVTADAPAGKPAGLAPNVSRPKGFQVWNSDVLAPDFDLDFGDPAEPLRPITVVGTRGGSFNGKVVVGSTETIVGLRATVSDLKGTHGGAIPSGAVRVRYALPDGSETAAAARYLAVVNRFEGLEETPPAEVPVRVKKHGKKNWPDGDAPKEVFGAVVPVWLTVKVPTDARGGDYEGTLTVSAKGVAPVRAPVHLKVHAYRMCAPHDFRTFCELIQSPDSLALHYNVPMWSEEHFKLIERSFRAIAAVGNKTVYVPLICQMNLGNAQSMVRWVRKPGGGYTYDFSILERYLDLYAKHCGKPEAVGVGVWEAFLEGGTVNQRRYARAELKDAFDKAKGLGPLVTLLDADTGKTEDLQLPLYTAGPQSKTLWKPLLDALRARLKKRGWNEQMLLGYCHDELPSKEVVMFFKELAPGMAWMRQAHNGRRNLYGVPYGLKMYVWQIGYLEWPDTKYRHGWQRPEVMFPRCFRAWRPHATLRLLGEVNIIGDQRGFGRLGADFWPVFKDRRGRPVGTCATRYLKSNWRGLTINTSLLAPGKTGPLSTVHIEMIREGLQECEARITVEEALLDETARKKLDAGLVRRCEAMLIDRTLTTVIALKSHLSSGFVKGGHHAWGWRWHPGQVGHRWFLGSGWQQRSDTLYALAAEVAARTK